MLTVLAILHRLLLIHTVPTACDNATPSARARRASALLQARLAQNFGKKCQKAETRLSELQQKAVATQGTLHQ